MESKVVKRIQRDLCFDVLGAVGTLLVARRERRRGGKMALLGFLAVAVVDVFEGREVGRQGERTVDFGELGRQCGFVEVPGVGHMRSVGSCRPGPHVN